jgi:hypothetical protein
MKDGRLGQGQDIFLTNTLDTWRTDAVGSSARVFRGSYRNSNGLRRMGVFKFMRPPGTEDHDPVDYGRTMFFEEGPILQQLCEVPGVMRMFELGFLKLKDVHKIPPDFDPKTGQLNPGSGRDLEGDLIRLTTSETGFYEEQMDEMIAKGWVPYLLLKLYQESDNLILICGSNKNNGHYFPLHKGLNCAIQACDILQIAHEHDIVYRDHKIVHYYWDDDRQQLTMIDWNVAKRCPDGVTQNEINHDLIEFSSRALHYILTGRASLGAKSTTSRTEEVELAGHSVQANFTYDDRKHLPKEVRDVLVQSLAGNYNSAQALGEDLKTLLASLHG